MSLQIHDPVSSISSCWIFSCGKSREGFEMEKKIGKATLDKTSKCHYRFSCLEGNRECMCEVSYKVSNIVFVNPPKGKSCIHMIHFGNAFFCNCPTRLELYKQS